jgi:tRNA threonylcarbamoyladenosine biosynthesis protein TsaE
MTTSHSIETHSVAETIALGERLGRELPTGTVLALSGELGAGKTARVKGLARGLGIAQEVTSPTFTLIHEYRGGRLPLYHIDLYRLDSVAQAVSIGIEDYLAPHGITVIEWAEKITALLPSTTQHIRLEVVCNDTRRIQFP